MVYVTAEVSGRTPAEVIADVSADLGSEGRMAKTGVRVVSSTAAAGIPGILRRIFRFPGLVRVNGKLHSMYSVTWAWLLFLH